MPDRVAFFLSGAARIIRGGHKVLLTYANFLSKSGFDVTLFFPAMNSTNDRGIESPARIARYLFGVAAPRIYLPSDWMPLHSEIQNRWIVRALPRHARAFDVSVIADHAVAADVMRESTSRPASKMLYLFQEYEYYMAGDAAVRAAIEKTIRSADAVVAISPATENLALSFASAQRVYRVNDGVELDTFFVQDAPAQAERRGIGFAFREEEFKRTRDIVEALDALRGRRGLRGYACWAYGSRRADLLPAWVEYHYRPSSQTLRGLLNRSALFVVASRYEGWGLPGAEAMACGAALVTSRNGGCEAYACHEGNALLFSPGDVAELTQAIARLIDDQALRARLAAEGRRTIRQFGWDRACGGFLDVIHSLL